jgi:peptidoglycan/LPS O-acetylase OafA/YrhL
VAEANAPPRSEPDGFRSDINGLRAISIALVVAYHLAAPLAPGGFIGVDVFFVISGFLMTNIIVGRLRQGSFRLGDFYLSRLRRIWPALAALCLALWAIGATLIDPWTFERIAADIPGVLAFVSNIVLVGREGYFAPDERANWLLHTWSLSVEWQFYLLYPLLLLGLFAVPALRRRLWIVLWALTAVSFVLAVAMSARNQGWSFYLLPTRAWELLAGSLCAGAGRPTLSGVQRAALHAVGLALIGLGAWLAIPAAGWPSTVALLPVGGAALVIVGAMQRTVWAEIPIVDGLGRASYSIYLWHWPVIVALRYAAIPLDGPVALAAVSAMLGLGFASYWLIERRLTGWLFAPRPWRWAIGLAGVAALAGLAAAAAQTRGLEAMRTANAATSERAAMADLRAASADWFYPGDCGQRLGQTRFKVCQIGDPAARQVLVLGDSQAEQVAQRYVHAFDGQPGRGITLVAGGCMPVPGVGLRYRGDGCARWSDAAFRYAESAGFHRVVIVSAWTVYFVPRPGLPEGLACLADDGRCEPDPPSMAALADAAFGRLDAEVVRLRQLGKDVVLMAPMPGGDSVEPLWLYRRLLRTHQFAPPPFPRAEFERGAALERDRLALVTAATGAALVEPLDALCPRGLCPVEDGGHALYRDAVHYRGSAMTQPRFAYLDPWLAPGPARLK